jgi:hypothetical protein
MIEAGARAAAAGCGSGGCESRSGCGDRGHLVARDADLSRWTVLVIGTIVLAFYVLAGGT